jgi:hypothetical protein
MNLHRRLAAVIVILALVGCVQVATDREKRPISYSPDKNRYLLT